MGIRQRLDLRDEISGFLDSRWGVNTLDMERPSRFWGRPLGPWAYRYHDPDYPAPVTLAVRFARWGGDRDPAEGPNGPVLEINTKNHGVILGWMRPPKPAKSKPGGYLGLDELLGRG